MIAVTAQCNARCIGCRYGRDFMPGQILPMKIVRHVIEDAAAAGFQVIRFYGGEPLLHPDLADMVRECRESGMQPYVTTNAILLDRHVEELYHAGLRDITIGFYGVGKAYDDYVERKGAFEKVEHSIATTRDRFGKDIELQINWLLMRPTCNDESIEAALTFAEKYDVAMQIELIHYSLPYFQEGPDRVLQFRPEDEPAIRRIVDVLLREKLRNPRRINQSPTTLRSIPDWLLKGPGMRVPCTAYEMIWVGADGSVQLCYVTFPLGSLHETPFSEMLRSNERRKAARDAFLLNCPNCHCGANDRITRHAPSRRIYV